MRGSRRHRTASSCSSHRACSRSLRPLLLVSTDDPPFRAIFEIGIWDGGSTAFWFEYFQPDKLVAVDYLGREDSEYFRSFVDARGIADRVKTYWGVDQGDSGAGAEIVDAEFGARSTS